MKKKEITLEEFRKRGGRALALKYPNHEPQRLGGKRGAATKLRNDPDYFKKIRAIGIAKQQQKKRELESPANRIMRLILGED